MTGAILLGIAGGVTILAVGRYMPLYPALKSQMKKSGFSVALSNGFSKTVEKMKAVVAEARTEFEAQQEAQISRFTDHADTVVNEEISVEIWEREGGEDVREVRL